jgi:hypothetical protein
VVGSEMFFDRQDCALSLGVKVIRKRPAVKREAEENWSSQLHMDFGFMFLFNYA